MAKKKVKYFANPGAPITDQDAVVIGKRLDYLRKRATNGRIDHKDFLNDARSPSSPTHSYFNWDDQSAAEVHRLDRARHLISYVQIEIVRHHRKERTRAFHIVNMQAPETGKKVATVPEVRASPHYSGQVVKHALRNLETWYTKFEQYRDLFPAELQEVTDAIANLFSHC